MQLVWRFRADRLDKMLLHRRTMMYAKTIVIRYHLFRSLMGPTHTIAIIVCNSTTVLGCTIIVL